GRKAVPLTTGGTTPLVPPSAVVGGLGDAQRGHGLLPGERRARDGPEEPLDPLDGVAGRREVGAQVVDELLVRRVHGAIVPRAPRAPPHPPRRAAPWRPSPPPAPKVHAQPGLHGGCSGRCGHRGRSEPQESHLGTRTTLPALTARP